MIQRLQLVWLQGRGRPDCFGVFTNYKMYHSRSSKITSQVTLVMFFWTTVFNLIIFREQSVLLEDSNILHRWQNCTKVETFAHHTGRFCVEGELEGLDLKMPVIFWKITGGLLFSLYVRQNFFNLLKSKIKIWKNKLKVLLYQK